MANASDLLNFAMAAVNKQPPLLYGQRAINGLGQRGPNSYDCVGFYRWCVQSVAPDLWPISWGGPDCWIVGCYWDACKGRYTEAADTPLPGDALVWFDNAGVAQHIGIADGIGNVISALNTELNICIVPISSVAWPVVRVIHTRLEQDDMSDVMGTAVLLNSNNAPATSLADVATSTRIIDSTGKLVTPNNFTYSVFGFASSAPGHAEAAWRIVQNGQPYYLLARNCFFTLA